MPPASDGARGTGGEGREGYQTPLTPNVQLMPLTS